MRSFLVNSDEEESQIKREAGNLRREYHDSIAKTFLDSLKKTLAFILKVGVACLPVQGLEIARSPFDGGFAQRDPVVSVERVTQTAAYGLG